MLKRPSARLLIVNGKRELLLFRFYEGELAGQVFWATPGGGLEEGETYEDAARRELFEEVGLMVDHPGPQVARRLATFPLPTGEMVEADERYFLIEVDEHEVSSANWSQLERGLISSHRWWKQDELRGTIEQVWPEDLTAMLAKAGLWTACR